MATGRKIIHIDMDAFFASVEQRDQPDYRGKPIVVGGSPDKRGVVAAASYEARKFGIHSAMATRFAVQRCPNLIVVKPRFEVYQEVSQQIRAIFHRYTNLVEPLSLDEAYLDVTVNRMRISSAVAIARDIKQQIQAETQLTASAGVSINKFLAKMASGMDKPNGLYLIAPEQAEGFLETLLIEKFYGIGQATTAKLKQLGIYRGADLKAWSEAALMKQFGKAGSHYYKIVRALDDRPVNPNRIRKSVGAERTFETDLEEAEALCLALKKIAQDVQERLAKHHCIGYTLTLKIKYANYQQVSRRITLPSPIQDTDAIYPIARELLLTHRDEEQKIRLLGITISNLNRTVGEPSYIQLALPNLV